MIGHSLGAAGSLEAVACVQTLLAQEIHPTINQEFPDPECDLNYVPNHSIQKNIHGEYSCVECVCKMHLGRIGQIRANPGT